MFVYEARQGIPEDRDTYRGSEGIKELTKYTFMGNDLYWKKTPKKEEEEYKCISYTTWHFLSKLYNQEEKEDLSGLELGRDSLEKLKIVLFTAKECSDDELASDINGMILGIEKYGSITLAVRG